MYQNTNQYHECLAQKNVMCKFIFENSPDEVVKTCAQTSTNQIAEICCISECNDRKGAKIVTPITECELS